MLELFDDESKIEYEKLKAESDCLLSSFHEKRLQGENVWSPDMLSKAYRIQELGYKLMELSASQIFGSLFKNIELPKDMTGEQFLVNLKAKVNELHKKIDET